MSRRPLPRALHAFTVAALTLSLAACGQTMGTRTGAQETTVQAPTPAPVNPNDVLRAEVQREDRVYRTSARLLTAGVDYCPSNISLDPGFTVWNAYYYGEGNRALLESAYALSGQTQIRALAPWIGQQGYDLRVGDTLTAVGGTALPSGVGAAEVYNSALITDLADEVVELTIQRGGEALQGQVQAQLICFFLFEPLSSERIESTVNGEVIAISDGLYRLADTDPLLAAILAQEIATALQAGPDLPPAAPQFAQLDAQFGVSAGQTYRDTIAMDLLARAGLDPAQVGRMWTLIGQQPPATVSERWAQPMTPQRQTWLQQTAERAAQSASGL